MDVVRRRRAAAAADRAATAPRDDRPSPRGALHDAGPGGGTRRSGPRRSGGRGVSVRPLLTIGVREHRPHARRASATSRWFVSMWYDSLFQRTETRMSSVNGFGTRKDLNVGGSTFKIYSLAALEAAGFP